MRPDLDRWLAKPTIRVAHRRESTAPPDRLWNAGRAVRLSDTRMLNRLMRWRIPGVPSETSFDELFRGSPFLVLAENEGQALVSGLVGRIWTLRRDYPELHDPEDFVSWSQRGTARVVFANWVEAAGGGGSALNSETRVEAIGTQGRLGVRAVRPLVSAFHHLIGTEAITAAVRKAETS